MDKKLLKAFIANNKICVRYRARWSGLYANRRYNKVICFDSNPLLVF